MKNKETIKELKKFPKETQVTITINLNKHSLGEECYHSGEWNGYPFTCSSYTSWKRGTLKDVGMLAEDLINLLKKKELSEMTSSDFIDIQLVESSDGDISVNDIEWGEQPSEEDMEDFNEMDLYLDSDINDSDYEFDEQSVYLLEIEIGDKKIEIN